MIHYLSDAEGRWDKLVDAAQGGLALDGDRLVLAPGHRLVYGGDTVDRGPGSRRILRALVEAAETWPDRVVLLAGNRDINKLRLPRELGDFPRPDLPGPLPERLQATLARTMGAGHAWAHRVAELGEGAAAPDIDPHRVVQSFLDDVGEDGLLLRYLRLARLAFRDGETLFVHGAVVDESYGHVPGEASRIDGLDAWIAGLNDFYQRRIADYRADPLGERHLPLVAYQAPLPGTRAHQASVVYGRPATPIGEPRLPSIGLQRRLMDQGVRRLVVGHTPMGDCPALLRQDGFEQLIADTSYAPLERGLLVTIDGPRLRLAGSARVSPPLALPAAGRPPRGDGDVRFDMALHLDEPTPIGRVEADGFRLRAEAVAGGWVVARFHPGWRVEQGWRG